MSVSDRQPSKAGIKTSDDGSSYIPSSTRADGSTRREIRVRPGYKPPEDVETYKNRGVEAWKTRGTGGVPGADEVAKVAAGGDSKSKNAKRREAARKKAAADSTSEEKMTTAMETHTIAYHDKATSDWRTPENLAANPTPESDAEAERQKKIRNQLKKLKAVKELKDKKTAGEKLSHDQLVKVGKEAEILRDLKKLNYTGPELDETDETDANAAAHSDQLG